jgi:hypothetical protein
MNLKVEEVEGNDWEKVTRFVEGGVVEVFVVVERVVTVVAVVIGVVNVLVVNCVGLVVVVVDGFVPISAVRGGLALFVGSGFSLHIWRLMVGMVSQGGMRSGCDIKKASR